jgi:regulator of sigma E protease
LIGFLETFASFVLVVGILVFVHELGHFLVAKGFGIGVHVFSLGFGPRLAGFRRGGTEYKVCAVPLGGYVRLAGEEPSDALRGGAEEFLSRPRWQRVLVYLAGPTFNVVLAVAVMWVVLVAYGKEEVPLPKTYPVVADILRASSAEKAGIRRGDRIISVAGRDMRDPQTEFDEILMSPDQRKPVLVERDGQKLSIDMDTGADPKLALGFPGWLLLTENPGPPVVASVNRGYPAYGAGIRPGDKVLAAGDREPVDEIHLRALLAASADKPVSLTLEREGRRVGVVVTPRGEGGRGVIGVTFRAVEMIRRSFGPIEAMRESIRINIDLSMTVFKTLRKLVRREISMRAFSGPLEIARVSREAARRLESFLGLLAFISLQLGIINLLPIPVLDGGHILILAIEGAVRRDLSEKVKERVIQAGMVFLLAFFAIIIYLDVMKAL